MLYMCHNVAWKSTAWSSNYLITVHLAEMSGNMHGNTHKHQLNQLSKHHVYVVQNLFQLSLKALASHMSSKFLVLPLSDMELISKTLPVQETMALAVKYFLSRKTFNKCTIKLCKHWTLHLDCFHLHQIFRNQCVMTRNTMVYTLQKRIWSWAAQAFLITKNYIQPCEEWSVWDFCNIYVSINLLYGIVLILRWNNPLKRSIPQSLL